MSLNNKLLQVIIPGIFMVVLCSSCKKYLDAKSDSRLALPSTYEDLRAILDNDFILNTMPVQLNISTDEFYLSDATWQSQGQAAQIYIWNYSPIADDVADWGSCYTRIFNCNTVLENIEKVKTNSKQNVDQLKGEALFFRAWHFYQLAQCYAPQYDQSSATSDLGIALRLSSDINSRTTRSTVQETYDQILEDLQEALSYLPELQNPRTRPSQAAAYALLGRVYLQMANYQRALENSDKCLALYNGLMDFNNTEYAGVFPFKRLNEEVIFHGATYVINALFYVTKADTTLYQSYSNNDLRKELFFEVSDDNSIVYTGTYNGDVVVYAFTGLATDEILLNRAECYVRLGNVADAMTDLNSLLVKRYKTGTFTDLQASTPEEALTIILSERKKELINRGTRWSDLKRLNKEPQYATTLKRVIAGQTYLLPPNDPRYTFQIPQSVIQQTGIQQNPK